MLIPVETPINAIVEGRHPQAMRDDDVCRVLVSMFAGKDVESAESELLQHEQAECPVIHRFGPGIYIRELSMKAGTFAIGHRQKFDHTNIVLKGRATIFNDDGTTTEVIGPTVFVGKPGRKMGYIHEDIVWQNIYATTETDIETLESMFLEKSASWSREFSYSDEIDLDRADYFAMLAEVGISHDVAKAQSENLADQIGFPCGGYPMMISDSLRNGKGVFATADISPGTTIAPARIGGMRTPAGRFTNHSANPNAEMVMRRNGDIDLVAIKEINGCKGGQIGEEITIDYRQALSLSGVRRLLK